MKLIKVSQGYEMKVDDADFERVSRYRWHILKSHGRFYAYRTNPANRKSQQAAHHFILGTKFLKSKEVDHRDHDGLNNQRSNLRPCTRAQNNANQRKWSKPTYSRFKGVSWHKQKGKWRAYIKTNGRQFHLGLFSSEEEAAKSYQHAAIKLFGEFAHA